MCTGTLVRYEQTVGLSGMERSHPALACGDYLRLALHDAGRGLRSSTSHLDLSHFGRTSPCPPV